MKNIVIIGGGTGTFTLLSGLRKFPTNNSVIVSTADDGGSTGRLVKELGVVPPGDIRQCLVGLSYTDETLRDLFSYRFETGSLKGHALGNIIISALEKITGSVESAIAEAGKLLNVRGSVVPVTLFATKLSAMLKNGKKIVGEHNLDERHQQGLVPIRKLSLAPDSPANPAALKLIADADLIILGPGDLFTSTLPNLVVKGVAQALKKSKAEKVLVTNIMTKFGQTDAFGANDFVKTVEQYLGKEVLDLVIVNTKRPAKGWLVRYRKEKSEFVNPNIDLIKVNGIRVIAGSFLSDQVFKKNPADALNRSHLRHDSDKLAKVIYENI